eukprot:10670187-Alexandrium_andersonii.AAC.1
MPTPSPSPYSTVEATDATDEPLEVGGCRQFVLKYCSKTDGHSGSSAKRVRSGAVNAQGCDC